MGRYQDTDTRSSYRKKNVPTTRRVCLRCNKLFPSTGPGNRICPKCNVHNAKKITHTTTKDPSSVRKVGGGDK